MVFRDRAKDGTVRLTGAVLTIQDIFDVVHPIGSIYFSVDNTNPAALFGGTWVAWGAGRVPVGVNAADASFDAVEETGGNKTVVLTEANLPPHDHQMDHAHQSVSSGTAGGSTLAFLRSANTATTTGGGMVQLFTGRTDNGDGTSQPVNVLQPYITCYMWKRTA